MRVLVAICVLVLLCHCGAGKEGSSFNATAHPDGGSADGGADSG